MRENILTAVVIRFQICIFDILNTAGGKCMTIDCKL